MTQTNVAFTVAELLKWAWDETGVADTIEAISKNGAFDDEVLIHRRRSRWLDQQVEFVLDQQTGEEL